MLAVAGLLLVLFSAQPALAQQDPLSTTLSIRFENNSLPEAFDKIAAAAGVSFSYDPDILPARKTVTGVFEKITLRNVLDFVLKDTELGCVTLRQRIIIKLKSELEEAKPPVLVTLRGFVRDSVTGEELIGANLWETKDFRGCSANEYGYYSLTLPEGVYELKASYLGYRDFSTKVQFDRGKQLDILLKPATGELAVVVVTDSVKGQENRALGEQKLPLGLSGSLPAVLGEKDVLKTMQLLPGVTSASDGISSFGVRGGTPDQTLILLDEAPVYNPTHLLGFFSIFNPETLKEVKLRKGALPAQYGGRLASVVEVFMKEGNANRFTTSGGIGLTSARLQMEAPIFNERGSFMVSGRRTYQDWLVRGFKNKDGFHFFDANLKGNIRLDPKNRLFVAGYFGRDVFRVEDEFDFHWGNATATLRWNRLLGEKAFLNTSLIFSDYRFNVTAEVTNYARNHSGILNLHVKQTYRRFLRPGSTLTMGWSSILHRFKPGDYRVLEGDSLRIPDRVALEAAGFVSHEWKATPWLEIHSGLRMSNMALFGTNEPFYYFDESGALTDSVFYKGGELIKNYSGLEPRVLFKFQPTKFYNLQLSYTRSKQYVQLVGNSLINNPIDIWLPASPNIRPQVSDQVDAGYFRQLSDGSWEVSAEVFYKHLDNQIEYRFPQVLTPSVDIESRLAFGDGWGYGTELTLKKNAGRLQGWLGYAWAKHRRRFGQLNSGEAFPARFDHTHSASVVGAYELSKRWTAAAVWTYRTGNAATVAAGKYQFNGQTIVYFTPINYYRLPAYHRLDITFTSKKKKGKYWESNWVLGLYNVYARRNPIFAETQQSNKDPDKLEVVLIAPLLVIPTVSWEFRF